MNTLRVSVVIPAHNEQEWIATTIQALLAQDYPNKEIIVVDNASTDRTSEIAKQFDVKVVLETRKGLLYARERGRVEASGDVIANVDADCQPDPNWISRGVEFLESRGCAAVTGPYFYFDSPWLFRNSSLLVQRTTYPAVCTSMQLLGLGAVLIGGNNFIRASALREIGGYDTSIVFYGEDTDTAKRVAKVGKVAFINRLTMRTSGRRFTNQGTAYTVLLYFVNFFWVTLFMNTYRKIRRTPNASRIHEA
jgi:glycosyltransferase involved in cell wall biosynthesis